MVDWEDIILTREDQESNLCIEVELVWDRKIKGVHTWFKDKYKGRTYKKEGLLYVMGPRTVLYQRALDKIDFDGHIHFLQNEALLAEWKLMGCLKNALRNEAEQEQEEFELLVLSDMKTDWIDAVGFGLGMIGSYSASYTGFKLID
ncbi:hypothetical protein KY338_06370 [Candidatus Woesearchaeota archaeon]|nr:hypothetical protein [Candidatus Woesearchaeota archaeon]MBW3005512.1 hypothetical protein [Candidatus Woesearchaeota archaeon]